MKLKHITFTGIDGRTNVEDLIKIQKQYPLAEFGVLTSYHWYENGNRYLDPKLIMLIAKELNLSFHVCGSAAHDATLGNWEKMDKLTFGMLHLFKRVQLNVSNRKDNPEYCMIPFVGGQELIVQQKGVNKVDLFKNTLKRWTTGICHRNTISVLLDASGGQGIDTPIEVLQGNYKVGYAGGINPDNVEEKLTCLLSSDAVGDFWIDMETGVRTDDWFDTNKVVDVLEKCYRIINNIK